MSYPMPALFADSHEKSVALLFLALAAADPSDLQQKLDMAVDNVTEWFHQEDKQMIADQAFKPAAEFVREHSQIEVLQAAHAIGVQMTIDLDLEHRQRMLDALVRVVMADAQATANELGVLAVIADATKINIDFDGAAVTDYLAQLV